jgi:hypothetical protein
MLIGSRAENSYVGVAREIIVIGRFGEGGLDGNRKFSKLRMSANPIG